MVHTCRSVVFVPKGRPVPRGVGDELASSVGDESARNALQRAKDGMVSGAWVAHISQESLAGVRVEADVEGGDRLDRPVWPGPLAFAPGRYRGSNEPAQSLEYPRTPQGRVAPHIPALADQPVGVPDVLEPQQIQPCHRRIPLFRGIVADPKPRLRPLRGSWANVWPVAVTCQVETLGRIAVWAFSRSGP